MAKSKLMENYDTSIGLVREIFASDVRVRIIRCLDESARFFDEIVGYVEAEEHDVRQNLDALEKLNVVQCIDEIYSLTRDLGVQSAKFINDFGDLGRQYL